MRHLHEQHDLFLFSLYCSSTRLELCLGGLGVGGAVTTLLEGLPLLLPLVEFFLNENFDDRGGVAGATGCVG